MLRTHLLLPLLLTGLVGILWGCAPAPQQTPVADKSVDARITKLERELKTVQDSSNALAAQIKQEQARVVEVEKEREDLRAQLKAKHAERELVQSQYDGFRKGVRELLAQADAAAAPKSTTETPAGQPVAQK